MTTNKILKNLSWLFFDKIIRIFGSLFVGVWVARYLGPENFGILGYALAYTSFFTLFMQLGLDQIVIREIVKTPKLTIYLEGTTFWLKLVGSIIAILLILISLFFIDIDRITSIVILVTSLAFVFHSMDIIDFFYQSQVLSKYVVLARNSAFILSSILKVYLILNDFSVIYFAFVNVLDTLLAAIFLIYVYQKNGRDIFQWKFNKKVAIKLLKYSWPLALSVFLISIHMQIDQIMIGNMLSMKDVGVYSVAVKLAGFWMFIPVIIVTTLMPYFIELREQDRDLYEYRLIQLYSLMFWMGLFIGTIVSLYGQDIIRLLYGEEYIHAYDALVLNIWNGIFLSQAIARGIWTISENMQKYRVYNSIIAVILNISTNLLLIPQMGITGAAIATLITFFLVNWVFSFLWKPLRKSTWGMIKSVNPYYLITWRK